MAHKILLVDDDKEIIETLGPRLQREGYDVVTAYDGEEALLKLKGENPDIILLDLIMPKMNGFEVLKEIRARHNDKWRPVIIISAQHDLESVKKGYELEADHYLSKPCTIDNVLRGIRTMISLIPARLH
jgi:DNA-binding response OmpR family regulator